MNTLAIDIETYSSIDLAKQGLYRYKESDDFEILLFAYKLNEEPVEVIDLVKDKILPQFIIDLLYDENTLKTAYNTNFEFECINEHLKRNELAPMKLNQWDDTMFLSAYAGYGGSLKNTALLLGLPENSQKDRSGTLLINKFSKPRKPTKYDKRTRNMPEDDPKSWERFIEYNRQDVVVESAIREKLKKIKPPELERKAFELDYKIISNGVLIDTDLVDSALQLDEYEKTRLKQEICELTGIENPKSNVQFTAWLEKELGHPVSSISKDALPEVLEECKELNRDDLIEVLNKRSELHKTSLAKYKAISRMICKDNRIRGMLQFYGTRTGRWAGRGVQVQNLPRNYIDTLDYARNTLKSGNFELLQILYGNLSDTASQLIRTIFIPEKDHFFAVADYSAIEARVIAWLSGEEWRLDVFKNKGGKIYEASAAQLFNVKFEDVCDKSKPEHKFRAQGKVAELALGYGGGVNAITRFDFNNDIPDSQKQGIVNTWRKRSPNIVKLWNDCQRAAEAVITGQAQAVNVKSLTFTYPDNTLAIKLPSGRSLYYPDTRIENGEITYLGQNQTTKKIERIKLWGGKCVENLVQGIARDCLSEALLRLDSLDFEIRFHVHDEVIVEVEEKFRKTALKDIIDLMCIPPKWARDLPLNAAGFECDFYQKD